MSGFHRSHVAFSPIMSGSGRGAPAALAPVDVTSLDGTWRLQLDREDRGVNERWFTSRLPGSVKLPGSLPAQGIGDDVSVQTGWTGEIVDRTWFRAPEYAKYRQPGNIKIPFCLQPEKYYSGAAWYQRDFEIPAAWRGKRLVLTLERPHWETRVWIDDRDMGSQNSLSTPHTYDLGTTLTDGTHQITIRVDNRLIVDIGINSHSITDHTQGNWNGIVGRIALTASRPVWIDDLQVYPHPGTHSVTVKGSLGNTGGTTGRGIVQLVTEPVSAKQPRMLPPTSTEVRWDEHGGSFEVEYPLGDGAELWDEFNPALYMLSATLEATGDTRSVIFGLREIATLGTQFTLNGRKLFFRGTLECAIFPRTGHPPTDIASWKWIIRVARAHGLNLFRFHSWCPPEAAFIAGDELGFYFQVEAASWPSHATTLGDDKPVDRWVYAETDRILRAYGNHPSFLLMACGNEPGGDNQEAYLAGWLTRYRGADPRRLYTAASGWPEIPESQFLVTYEPRIQLWGAGLTSRINSQPPESRTDYREFIRARSVPVISHEVGQWCVFPNFEEIPKYTGHLKPKHFEIFRDMLDDHHMGDQAAQFVRASGKLQVLCYKEEIESALRTPGMGGFQLLDLHDFPGQGNGIVGVLDPFWESKGYVTPEEYSRFCSSTVLLARTSKRVFTIDEYLKADIEVAHFGPAPLTDALTTWRLLDDHGRVAAQGELPRRTIPVDNGVALGSVRIALNTLPAPRRYKLVVGLEGSRIENDWDIWVYPSDLSVQGPPDVRIVEELNADSLASLRAGGKVLLFIPLRKVKGDHRGRVALGFSGIFWNTAWTGRQAPHTLGILCDPEHPALADFPTEFHSNWQWWYLLHRAGAMILDETPENLRPIVQVIDDWYTNRKLAVLFEASVESGKLMVCSLNLKNDLNQNPVARQMLHSILRYMGSDRFLPAVTLSAGQVRGLMKEPTHKQIAGAHDGKVNSEVGEKAIDGDPWAVWQTQWESSGPTFPHDTFIDFGRVVKVRGFTALPRQDGGPNGWIDAYEFYASIDGKSWSSPLARGAFPPDAGLKTVAFSGAVEARFIRLVALSSHGRGPWTSLAKFEVVK